MRVLIVGAGAVGSHIAARLARERHPVTIIDRAPEKERLLAGRADAQVLVGSGASAATLRAAEVERADIFIAVTDSDEVNLIACFLAAKHGVPTVICRLKDPAYAVPEGEGDTEAGIDFRALGIHLVIQPELAVARDIRNMITRLPGAFDVAEFGGGQVLFLGCRVPPESPAVGKTLKELGALAPHPFVVTALLRKRPEKKDTMTLIPRGADRIQADDVVYFTVAARHVAAVRALFTPTPKRERNVFIHGATYVGRLLARRLAGEYRVRLFDAVKERCAQASRELRQVPVFQAAPTDVDLLRQEGLEECDVYVAATDDDRENIVSGLMARHHGARRVIPVVHEPAYVDMVQRYGVDRCVSPRVAAANAVLRFLRRGRILSALKLEGIEAEVLEFQLEGQLPILGKPLRDVAVPRGAIVGSVVRREEPIIPRGDTRLEAGDQVVVFALPDAVEAVQNLFSA